MGRPEIDDSGEAPAIRLSGVSIVYGAPAGATTIVEDFDLDLPRGRLHCLAGRSGSGKTSVLRVAAGLLEPSAGAVSWNGIRIDGLRDAARAELRRSTVGYLDQGGTLIEGLSALENVLIPAVPDRRTRALAGRARELLETFGVAHRARARPGQLSGGERQRVAFARSMLLSPAALVGDEPTASLDRVNADRVIDALRAVAAEGTAVLVAAHDPELIAASDSVTDFG